MKNILLNKKLVFLIFIALFFGFWFINKGNFVKPVYACTSDGECGAGNVCRKTNPSDYEGSCISSGCNLSCGSCAAGWFCDACSGTCQSESGGGGGGGGGSLPSGNQCKNFNFDGTNLMGNAGAWQGAPADDPTAPCGYCRTSNIFITEPTTGKVVQLGTAIGCKQDGSLSRFSFPLPPIFKDGQTHTLKVLAGSSGQWYCESNEALCGQFTVQPPSATPTPPRSPTLTPAGPSATPVACPVRTLPPVNLNISCSLKNFGDANCDNKIDSADFRMWLSQFDTMAPTNPRNQNANFACVEGNPQTYFVDLTDFEVWRRSTLEGLVCK